MYSLKLLLSVTTVTRFQFGFDSSTFSPYITLQHPCSPPKLSDPPSRSDMLFFSPLPSSLSPAAWVSAWSSLFSQAGLFLHWISLWHMGTACFCIFKIFLITLFPYSVSSAFLDFFTLQNWFQGALSVHVLKRPKSACLKPKAAILLVPILTWFRIENFINVVLPVPKMATMHTISPTSPSLLTKMYWDSSLGRLGGDSPGTPSRDLPPFSLSLRSPPAYWGWGSSWDAVCWHACLSVGRERRE